MRDRDAFVQIPVRRSSQRACRGVKVMKPSPLNRASRLAAADASVADAAVKYYFTHLHQPCRYNHFSRISDLAH